MNKKRLGNTVAIKEDLKWFKTQRVHYKKQRMYKRNVEFRREVKAVIFPCVTFKNKGRLRADINIDDVQEV